MLFRLGCGRTAEACRTRSGTSNACGSGNKLEQIKSNIFIAAGAETGSIEAIHNDFVSEN
jgi:hypothetical protein